MVTGYHQLRAEQFDGVPSQWSVPRAAVDAGVALVRA